MNCPKCNNHCTTLGNTLGKGIKCTKCNWYTVNLMKTIDLGIYEGILKKQLYAAPKKEPVMEKKTARKLTLGVLILYALAASFILSMFIIS